MYGKWIIYVLSSMKVLVVLASGSKEMVPIVKSLLKSCTSPLCVYHVIYIYYYIV